MDDMHNRDKFTKLAERLENTGDSKYKFIIERLRVLAYDDFANEEFPFPKMQMVTDLKSVGLMDDATDVINGEYDQ